jgi:hypothetical protein
MCWDRWSCLQARIRWAISRGAERCNGVRPHCTECWPPYSIWSTKQVYQDQLCHPNRPVPEALLAPNAACGRQYCYSDVQYASCCERPQPLLSRHRQAICVQPGGWTTSSNPIGKQGDDCSMPAGRERAGSGVDGDTVGKLSNTARSTICTGDVCTQQ